MSVAFAILPIFLTFVCGYVLVATKTLPTDRWEGIETLSFRFLIPVVLIKAIAGSDLSISKFGSMILALVAALTIAGLAILLLRRVFSHKQLPNPAFTKIGRAHV